VSNPSRIEQPPAVKKRLGFSIATVNRKQGELIRVGLGSRVRVGRYGINLETFEDLALLELTRPRPLGQGEREKAEGWLKAKINYAR